MTAERLLSRLEKVRPTGPGRWVAACPAHTNRSPSLAIRELDDGRILVHDFGGYDTRQVVDAVGLTLSDLFPLLTDHHTKAVRRPFYANDILRCVAHEISVAAIIAETLTRGEPLTELGHNRLALCMERLHGAAGLAND